MDRYDLRQITVLITPADETNGLHTNVVVAKSDDGEWVKYSDAMDAINKAQVDMARCNREGDDAVIRAKNAEIDKLQARVRELETALDHLPQVNVDEAKWQSKLNECQDGFLVVSDENRALQTRVRELGDELEELRLEIHHLNSLRDV